ncbi:hypothetical protein MCAMS1_00968 [biofilm metagenome]
MYYFRSINLALIVISLCLIDSGVANAAGINVDCRVRTDKPRSEILIQGTDFKPFKKKRRRKIKFKYYAIIYTDDGASVVTPPKVPDASRRLEFYFDSNASDLRPGDIQISPTWIKSTLTAHIRIQGTNAIVARRDQYPCRTD